MKKIWFALLNSLAGLKAAWKEEFAFRLEVLASLVFIPAAFFLTDIALERAILIATLFLVMAFELLNSAIEAAIDRMGEEIHPLAKKAKDCGSAAVLMALFIAAAVWLGVIMPLTLSP